MGGGLRERILVVVDRWGGPDSQAYADAMNADGWDVVLDVWGQPLGRLFDCTVLPFGVAADAGGGLSLAVARGEQTFTEWLLAAVG
jgi:hypothetical protein